MIFKRFLKSKNEQNKDKLKSLLRPFVEYLGDKGVDLTKFDEVDAKDYLKGNYKKYVDSVASGNKESLTDSTLVQVYDAILNFLKWQRDYADSPEQHFKRNQRFVRVRDANIITHTQKIKSRKWLSKDELHKLFVHSKARNERDYAIFHLLAYFGCRSGELFGGDNIIDIDWDERSIIFRTEKADFERINYFGAQQMRLLRKGLNQGWFERRPYHRLDEYKPLFEDLDFKFHSLRHTCNHHLKQKIDDELLLRLILGWKIDNKMSDYYDARGKQEIKEAMTTKHYFNDLDNNFSLTSKGR